MNDINEFAAQAGSRSQGYWLLSRLFLEPPSAAFLAEMQATVASADGCTSELQAEVAFLLSSIQDALQDAESAAVAFTRHLVLFAKDRGEPLPFESHFRGTSSPDELREELVQQLASWGYGAFSIPFAPPDHVGAELRLMACLCNDEREAWERGDLDKAKESLCRQSQWLSGHLAQWIPDYCQRLGERSENNYLKAIARITAASIEAEAKLLDAICSQLDLRSEG